MAIDLSLLILEVQVSLSDVPDTYITDEQIYSSLKMASSYIDSLKEVGTLESLESKAIVTLASFYSYINFTSLVERTRGEVPQASSIKLAALQRIAVSFLRRITTIPINDDTTTDQTAQRSKCIAAIGLTKSSLSEDLYD